MDELENTAFKLDAGSPVPWVVCRSITYTFIFALVHSSTYALHVVISQYYINTVILCYIEIVFVLLLLSVAISDIHWIIHAEFEVENGCLDGVDLWLVSRVRYDKHVIYLDKHKIKGVPNAKVLLQSLGTYYYEMTGEELP